jgi:tetratricopeptide (TPR) repeat protein
VDGRVPGYLGRILDGQGGPVGTCFQVVAGVLVTAWHVLEDIGAAEDAEVAIDPLAGGDGFVAVVARVDPMHDIAVLTSETALPTSAGPLTATDRMALRAGVTVTGHAMPDDPGHSYRFLDSAGEWAGGTTRDDAVPLGRVNAGSVVKGMSGAPVIRDGDGAVAGVVSGRYNSADGWLASTVWVARTEDLVVLLDGIATATMVGLPLAGAADLLLTVTKDEVRLTGAGTDVAAGHRGVSAGLAQAVDEARRARARAGRALDPQPQPAGQDGEFSLARAGRLLGESFLPGPVAGELARVLGAAQRAHQPVRLGLAVSPGLAGLPWEALPGPGGGPLALHPLVRLYRQAETGASRVLAGPLRIVVAIAAPDDSGGGLVDYERHLRNVIAAVRAARQGDAQVQVVPFATTAAIRAELDRAPAHVLHIYCHGRPGQLELEDDTGSARLVSAADFAAEAIPPGAMPPVISLSACYTDTAAADDMPSFAAVLCARGAAAVVGTETSVTDLYATRLFARVYGTLAASRTPDVIAALADARREVQRELESSPDWRDNELGGLGEWAVVTVLAGSAAVAVVDPDATAPTVRQPSRPQISGLAGREEWYFVGRRAEQRRWPAELTGPGAAGIVICGIGGTGKTTLAAELTARIRDRETAQVLVNLAGQLTLEGLLSAVITGVRGELLVRGHDGSAIRALDVAARPDLGWADRLAILRGHVLDRVPVLVLLDNFEDNLRPDSGSGWAVADEVLAGLLAAWVTDPGGSRLLVTSRHPFALPSGADRALWFRQLGALSRAETMKLAWSLPALDRLDERQLETVWRLVGGHPRSLEYLDALLAGGTARYPDVTARMDAAITSRLDGQEKNRWLAARTGLDAALAETVALAADDVLLDDLLTRLDAVPGAAALLTGVAVYREPVDNNAVLFTAGKPDPAAKDTPDREAAYQRIGEILAAAGIPADGPVDLASVSDEVRSELAPYLTELDRRPVPPYRPGPGLAGQVGACQAAGLVTVSGTGPEQRFFVHRWTATELVGPRPGPELASAHRRAAAYWQWRYETWPQDRAADVHDLLEARHHLLAAEDTDDATQITWPICRQLHTWGAWDQEAALIHDTLARLPDGSADQAGWLCQLGLVAQRRGDYDQAERHYQRALHVSEQVGDQAGMAPIYQRLGILAHQRGDYDQAERHYQRALHVSEQVGDQAGIAASYHNLGILAQHRGDYDQAERQYQRALDIKERLGDQASMALSYHQLGVLAQDRGDYDQAERQYQRSLDSFERLGDQASMAASISELGILAQIRGDYDQAERHYQRALDISERLGDQARMALIYHRLGILAQDRGDYDQAERQYQRALDIKERLGDQAGLADSYGQLGILAQNRGDYDQAERQYQRSLDISERLGDQASLADSYHNLGMLAQDRGDYDRAERHYQRSLDIHERLGDQAGMASSISQLGILEAERGAPPAAVITRHVTALAIRLRLGIPQVVIDLRCLAACREDLGPKQFTALLTQATGDTGQAGTITSLLDQLDAAATPGQRDQAEEEPTG